LGFHNTNSLKQQSASRHVALLWHIILIPNRHVALLWHLSWFRVFASTPLCCVIIGVAAYTNFIVFSLVWHDWGSTTRSNTFVVIRMFCESLFVLLSVFYCPSSIYAFWYFQTLLDTRKITKRHTIVHDTIHRIQKIMQ